MIVKVHWRKNKIKLSSFIRNSDGSGCKIIYEEGLPNRWGNANIESYMRRPLVIYDFATAPLWISFYMRKILFSFLSVFKTSIFFRNGIFFLKAFLQRGRVLSTRSWRDSVRGISSSLNTPCTTSDTVTASAARGAGIGPPRGTWRTLFLSLKKIGGKIIPLVNYSEYIPNQ